MTTEATPNTRDNYGARYVVLYAGRHYGCRKQITDRTTKQWQRAVSLSRPHCGRKGW